VDTERQCRRLIQSLYSLSASGVVAGDTGIVLQNRSAYFSLDPQHPNRLEPGKRPMHTLIASIALKDGRPWQVFGCMGPTASRRSICKATFRLIDFGFDIQQALELPRWLSGRFNIGDPRDLLNIEGRFSGGDREGNSSGGDTRRIAGLISASSPATRTASRSIRCRARALAAPIRGATAPRSVIDRHLQNLAHSGYELRGARAWFCSCRCHGCPLP